MPGLIQNRPELTLPVPDGTRVAAGSAEAGSQANLLRAAIDALTRNDVRELHRLLESVREWELARAPGAESAEAIALLRVLRLLLQSADRNLRLWRRVFAARSGNFYGNRYFRTLSPLSIGRFDL